MSEIQSVTMYFALLTKSGARIACSVRFGPAATFETMMRALRDTCHRFSPNDPLAAICIVPPHVHEAGVSISLQVLVSAVA